MSEQEGFGFEVKGPSDKRLREHHADFTPGPIVRQGLDFLAEHLHDFVPKTFLDPSAGAGVFGQQAIRVFPTLKELVGVEKREEEMQSVARWYGS